MSGLLPPRVPGYFLTGMWKLSMCQNLSYQPWFSMPLMFLIITYIKFSLRIIIKNRTCYSLPAVDCYSQLRLLKWPVLSVSGMWKAQGRFCYISNIQSISCLLQFALRTRSFSFSSCPLFMSTRSGVLLAQGSIVSYYYVLFIFQLCSPCQMATSAQILWNVHEGRRKTIY